LQGASGHGAVFTAQFSWRSFRGAVFVAQFLWRMLHAQQNTLPRKAAFRHKAINQREQCGKSFNPRKILPPSAIPKKAV
jgi:hypothetical protein